MKFSSSPTLAAVALIGTVAQVQAQQAVRPEKDIPTTAIDNGSFTTLVAALGAADLVDALSDPNGPFTVFAPTDEAFDTLPNGLVECLLEDENKGVLSNILLYHVVDGQVLSTDLSNGLEVPTLLEGEDVTVDLTDGVKINDSTVIKADVLTSNGVIHVVDAVLVPSSIDVAAFLSTCDVPARGDVELTVLSNADTTIYRDGLFQDSVNGNDNTMLIQNGPPGDLELASAYSLVELSFNANEIENLKNANAEFCLDHVINDKPADRVITYSTCLLIPLSDGSVDAMTGATSSYVMPDDCVGNKVVDFDVRPFDTTICVDVTPLLFGSNDRTIRRSLQEEKSLIMMIDNLVESDEPGDRFYTSNDETKSPPTLVIEGKGTVQDIDDNVDDDDDDDDDVPGSLCSKKYRNIMVIGMGLLLAQQFSGQPCVLAYSRVLFEAAGWGGHTSIITVTIMGVVSSFTVSMVDRLGRKTLLAAGSTIMLISVSCLSYGFWGWDENSSGALSDTKKQIVLWSMLVFISGYQIGFGPISWTVLSEIYPTEIRGSAMALSVEVNFFAKFLTQFSFPIIQGMIGWGTTFVVFACIILLGLIFIIFKVPETKGMTLEEIQLKLQGDGSSEKRNSRIRKIVTNTSSDSDFQYCNMDSISRSSVVLKDAKSQSDLAPIV